MIMIMITIIYFYYFIALFFHTFYFLFLDQPFRISNFFKPVCEKTPSVNNSFFCEFTLLSIAPLQILSLFIGQEKSS